VPAVGVGTPQRDAVLGQLPRFEGAEGVELLTEVAGWERAPVRGVGRDDGPEEQQTQPSQEKYNEDVLDPGVSLVSGH
jgi:hypothetical protein